MTRIATLQEHPRPNFAQTITQSGPVTAPSYRVRVNEALVQWLMSAPDGPDEQFTLEDFLSRPARQHFQRTFRRPSGPYVVVTDVGDGRRRYR
jgi:hypothetical protein